MKTVWMAGLVGTLGLLAGLAGLRAEEKKAEGFRPLFNGKDLTGWQNSQGKAANAGWVIEDGAMTRKKGAGDIWTKERFGDFVLEVEFKTKGNSGVFIRTDKPTDPVQTGIEIQVDNPSRSPGKHSVGAIYDLVAPSKMVAKKDQWNRVVITAIGNKLNVVMNGEPITNMDLDRWAEAGKNPDGSKNKFKTALKDFKREGHIGFQDHGAEVSYRNVRIRPISKGSARK
jgi:3-keto-disaccharide hydrolase